MKLLKNHTFPVLMTCIAITLCVVLAVLPIEEILSTYRMVNDVKTVEYVSKAEGIFKVIASSFGTSCVWFFLRNRYRTKYREEPGMISIRLRIICTDIIFFLYSLIPSIVCIISLVLWIKNC